MNKEAHVYPFEGGIEVKYPDLESQAPAMRQKAGICWEAILSFIAVVLFWLAILWAIGITATQAEAQVMQPAIDMNKIMMIESSGNPLAYRKIDDSIGLFQITPIVLKEWNNFHAKEQHTRADLWNPIINRKIADWYMNKRIPQMLKYFGKADTIPNRITAYNAGISYVAHDKPLPKITKLYIKKYYK